MSTREGMRLMIDFESCGFTLVGEAADAKRALKLIDEVKPHLMITDVKMPGLKGTQLAELVAQWKPEMLLFFISGYRDFEFAKSAIRAQALGYLVKPIEPDEVHALLRRAKDTLDKRAGAATDARADESAPMSDMARRALNYIEENYARELTVSHIASAMHINPAYLGQIVRRETGETIHTHLTRVRVEKARALLGATSMNISQIALSVGIADVGYFSLLFTRQVGMRPREYRKSRKTQAVED